MAVNQPAPGNEVEDIIICREVHKWFGHFHALRGVSTTIKRGEVVVILGPSGSGKSTFIRTINRLEHHQRGDIIVDGIELSGDVRNIDAIRREVGMVFQSFNLFPPPYRDAEHQPGPPPRSGSGPKTRPRRWRWNC